MTSTVLSLLPNCNLPINSTRLGSSLFSKSSLLRHNTWYVLGVSALPWVELEEEEEEEIRYALYKGV